MNITTLQLALLLITIRSTVHCDTTVLVAVVDYSRALRLVSSGTGAVRPGLEGGGGAWQWWWPTCDRGTFPVKTVTQSVAQICVLFKIPLNDEM